jgi:hypothetical protein
MAETIEELHRKLDLYEQDGAAKLYYSLRRKMNEMADLMNGINLKTIDIGEAKDKSFDRLKVIWQDASSIAQAVDALGKLAKVTGEEDKDVDRRPFNDRLAEDRG